MRTLEIAEGENFETGRRSPALLGMRRWSSRTSLREGRADLIDGFVELSEEVSRNCCFSRGWHCLVCTGVIGGHTFWYLLGW